MNPSDLLDRMRRAWQARNPPSREGFLPVVEIDWQDYFREFCIAHGRHPLFYAGRLLFADGWMHALDHRGPTWPPPENETERRKLQRAYWKLRKSAVKKELVRSRQALEQVDELLARAGGVPIRYVVRNVDDNEESETYGRVFTSRPPLTDLKQQLEQRLEWLVKDLELCELSIIEPSKEGSIEAFNQ